MMVAKTSYKIAYCCLFIACAAFFLFLNHSNAQTQVINNPVASSPAIKTPPPIEGFIPKNIRKPQVLSEADIIIESASGDSHNYRVELAVTAQEQTIGMMYREDIPENTGMLFLFNKAAERNFWMKDTVVPLDIIFIQKNGIIGHIHQMAEPETLDHISSKGKAIAVLELAGGSAELAEINVGDRVLYADFFNVE